MKRGTEIMNDMQRNAVKQLMVERYGNETIATNVTRIIEEEMAHGRQHLCDWLRANAGFCQSDLDTLFRLIEENNG